MSNTRHVIYLISDCSLICSFHLQIYKSTADFEQGKKMYNAYSGVNEEFLELRKVVLARKQPRRMLVQANTVLKGNVSYC